MNAKADITAAEVRRFEAYVKADPKNALLWTNLGDLYHQAGRVDEAVACYEKCLMLDEANMIARGRLANALITQHRFDEAEKIIRSILTRSGDDPTLLHNLGLTLFYQRRFDEAQRAFERARAIGLRAPKNLAYIVYSLHKKNDTGAALSLAKTWLDESPGTATEGYVAMLELDHGDVDAARARAERVLRAEPANPDANVVLGIACLEQQDTAGAIGHYERAVSTEPDNPRAWQGLGLAHLHRRNLPQALEALQKAQRSMPDSATNHLIIGWAKLANGDARGAEVAFRDAIKANHNFGEAHGGLATALVFQNRVDEARAEIKRAIGLDPKGFGAVFAESLALRLRGKERAGTKVLAELLEQQPLPRSKPLIGYIQDYLRAQGHLATPTPKPDETSKP
jgi:tetratricopeptide (TPR) repeat protein